MKILVVCQYYHPEPFRIKDICEEMVRRGHEVHVVTGYPNYPEGNIYPGYGKGKRIDEVVDGVRIHRCYTTPRKTGAIYRFLNYFSYAFSAAKYVKSRECVAMDGKDFDVVFCNQLSPVMMVKAAVEYKKAKNVRVVMYCLDLWPESLCAGGIRKGSIIYRVFHKISEKMYRQMDKILITSRMFSDYLAEEFAISKEKIEYLPQYAEGIFERIEAKEENGVFDFTFAGNIGAIQSVDTILKAAQILKEDPVRFHIVGGGSELERLKKLQEEKDISNVTFYGRRPLEDMPSFYEKADAMLITMKADPVLSLTLPGKVQSYMAAGKPIIGAINGETRTVIGDADCGFCGAAENAEELADNIRRFMSDARRKEMGNQARRYYEKHFEESQFMNRLEKELYENISI